MCSLQFSSVAQSCPTFATPWSAACQAFLSITNSQSLLKPMSIKSVMPSNHLIFCHPRLFLPSIFPSIRVFTKSVLRIRWPKYWSFSFLVYKCVYMHVKLFTCLHVCVLLCLTLCNPMDYSQPGSYVLGIF